jgi:glycine C-acetyltransferase/8-amino-7-oxononanoate synthase
MAALELLREQPGRVDKLARNAGAMREALASEGLDTSVSETQILPLIVGDAGAAMDACERALAQGVFCQAIRPPTVPHGSSRLRIAVMASHTKSELRWAAGVLARAIRAAVPEALPAGREELVPAGAAAGSGVRTQERPSRVFDGLSEAA